MKSNNLKTGKKGEEEAVRFLESNGFKILETNWRYHHKEIDIIAMDKEFLVIVEVKTRNTDYFGYPEQAVNRMKKRFLTEAANAYIFKNNIEPEVRFDIVAIVYEQNKRKLLHIKDAFIPGF